MLNIRKIKGASHISALKTVGYGCVMAVLSTTIARANPGPPYNTDDPEPVELRHWEAYIASMSLHSREGLFGTAPHFEFNYGAAPNLQLHIITPMAYAEPSGGPNTYGYGDTELGAKFRFVQEGRSVPMIGIFPLVELPTGAASRGLGSGQTQFFLPVWLQKTWGSWSSYGGGGYWHNPGPGNHDYWFFGLQAQCQITKNCSIGGELFHTTANQVGGRAHRGFNLGTVYDIDDGHHLLFSLGNSFQGEPSSSMYLAFQWTFGPREKK